jgi:hypothetical protein
MGNVFKRIKCHNSSFSELCRTSVHRALLLIVILHYALKQDLKLNCIIAAVS